MSKRHRRAIHHLNMARRWCRECERVMKRKVRFVGFSFTLTPSEELVRSIRRNV